MAFCSKCGKELVPGAKFCFECGAAVGEAGATARKTVYEGEVRKCPICGEILQSMMAYCPACGHEVSSSKMSPALQKFIDEINECDRLIADMPPYEYPRRGWAQWGCLMRVVWIFLNIFLLFIPLVIYLAWSLLLRPLFMHRAKSELSPVEQRKVTVIENFVFPNERASLLEALLFIQSKMAFLASEKVDDRTIFWMRLWNTKATDLYKNTKIILKDDPIAENAYKEISASKHIIDRKIRIRAGIVAAIVLAYVIIFCALYGASNGGGGVLSSSIVSPTIDENAVTDESEGIYVYEIRNYVGKNAASVGEASGNYLVDNYGSGELRIVFVTEDGTAISMLDDDAKKDYTVVAQNIEPGAKIAVVNERNSSGKPYSNLVEYQSYDEILLFVAPIGEASYEPSYTAILPTYDRHTYHVRDYVGRNAAAFGSTSSGKRIDEYGVGELRLSFTSEDGTYIDASDLNALKQYVVISQDIAPNTELELKYETNSQGREYDNLILSQNYEEINLTVRRLDDSIIAGMPEITSSSASSSSGGYVELTVKYKVLDNGDAEITGYSGGGNHLTIDSKIDGHTVVSIGDSAFQDCTTLESVLFWADIETIGDYAFAGCTALKSISIPSEMTSIGNHAFEGCTALESLIIWGSSNIGDYAFAGCTSITSVSISSGTERVGTHAFDGCTNLSSAIVWDDDTIVEKDAFANCPDLEGKAIQE